MTSQALTADVALVIDFPTQVTVGSRAAGAAAEKAVPVDIITRDQIASSGYTETAQVIQSLAPSFNFPRPTITDGTDTVRPATLRGLGPGSGAGARQRQAAAPERARAPERQHRPRVDRRGSERHSRCRRSITSRSCATAPRRSTDRTRSPASSTSCSRAGVAAPGRDRELRVCRRDRFRATRCTPNGLTCSTGDDIDFSDGGLARCRRLLGHRRRARAASRSPPSTGITTGRTARRSIRAIRSSPATPATTPSPSRITAGAIPTRATR